MTIDDLSIAVADCRGGWRRAPRKSAAVMKAEVNGSSRRVCGGTGVSSAERLIFDADGRTLKFGFGRERVWRGRGGRLFI